jgi:hypothetical protein
VTVLPRFRGYRRGGITTEDDMTKAGNDPYNFRSPTQQWMAEHPNDKPCPRGPDASKAWRRRRGLDAAGAVARRKYEMAMVQTRAARAARGEG